jgi:hypothetical protein
MHFQNFQVFNKIFPVQCHAQVPVFGQTFEVRVHGHNFGIDSPKLNHLHQRFIYWAEEADYHNWG